MEVENKVVFSNLLTQSTLVLWTACYELPVMITMIYTSCYTGVHLMLDIC